MSYLPAGLPSPDWDEKSVDAPFWEAARRHRLAVQRCAGCGTYRWGPEWICHACGSFDTRWEEVEGKGRIYSWERCWHPAHPALKEAGPYIVVLVELPHAGSIRLLGNLLGDPLADVSIGQEVRACFEDHQGPGKPFTLVHWQAVGV